MSDVGELSEAVPEAPAAAADVPLLRVTELKTHFDTARGVVRAVDGVTFDLDRG